MASKQAGNTGLRNEIVSICGELLRQKFCLLMPTKNLCWPQIKMLIIKRGYQRKYLVGGSGIFSKLKDFFQDSSVKSKLLTQLWTSLEVLGKRPDKKLLILRVQSGLPNHNKFYQNLCLQHLRLHLKEQHHGRHSRWHQIWTTWLLGRGSARSRFKTLSGGWINEQIKFFWKAWSPQKQYRWTQIFQQGNTWFKVKTKKRL